ncbi:MAG TPA: gliding motility-associated protein GldE [Chryseolinea sp.]
MDEPPSYYFFVNTYSLGISYPILIGVVILLVLVSALVSVSEMVFFSLQPEEIDQFKKSKERRHQTIASLMENPQLLLASMMLINTIVKVTIVTTAALAVLGADASIGKVLFTVLSTTLLLVLFSEFIPKVYAEHNKIELATKLARFWRNAVSLCRPLLYPVIKLRNVWSKRFIRERTTADELTQVLEMANGDKETSEGEKEILRGIVNFGTLTVRQVMKTREEISSINIDLNFHELLTYVNASGFSRIPVYKNTIDSITGVLYIKDLLPYLEYSQDFKWQDLIRPGLFVPETKKIDLLLKDFQEKRVHMAIVVSDAHSTIGLVTLEDLIEEIIGEINDEFDEIDQPFRKIDDTTFVFDGRTTFEDLCKLMEIENNTINKEFDDRDSLEKILLELSDELPHSGDQINFEQFSFVIESIVGKKIKRVRVIVHEEA